MREGGVSGYPPRAQKKQCCPKFGTAVLLYSFCKAVISAAKIKQRRTKMDARSISNQMEQVRREMATIDRNMETEKRSLDGYERQIQAIQRSAEPHRRRISELERKKRDLQRKLDTLDRDYRRALESEKKRK